MVLSELNPIRRNIEGINNPNVFTVRNVPDVTKIKNYLEDNDAKEVAIVGGGFIGIEVAENLHLAGYKTTIIEALDQVLNNFDYDMVQIFDMRNDGQGYNLCSQMPLLRFLMTRLNLLLAGKSSCLML